MSPLPELSGYTSALSVLPGDEVRAMVGSSADEVRLDLVEVLHGGGIPAGPGLSLRELEGGELGVCPGGMPSTANGSAFAAGLEDLDQGAIGLRFWPTLPADGPQAVADLGSGSHSLRLSLELCDARIAVIVRGGSGDRRVLTSDLASEERVWQLVVLAFDCADGRLALHHREVGGRWGRGSSLETKIESLPPLGSDFCLAARRRGRSLERHFDGKVVDPAISREALGLAEIESLPALGRLASSPFGSWSGWDLSPQPGSPTEVPGHGAPAGSVVGAPTRAVTGPRWDTGVQDWRTDPDGWAAIHFHRDDLDDAGWAPSAVWSVPERLPSGVYAIRAAAGRARDLLPVAVRHRGPQPAPSVAVLLPTMTYLAYANERLGREMVAPWPGWSPPPDPLDALTAAHPEWGLSLYDTHRDGSGVTLSSFLRPMPNTRPNYRSWFVDAGRHLGADLHLLWWLREHGIAHHVLTDHDLDEEGIDALQGSRVLLTGSHPEYMSGSMLDAFEGFARAGGRLMYLGGNGFYWVTTCGGRRRHQIEVRRGQKGTRAWESAPGEQHHAHSGEPGGLWRHRGRPPERLVGIGFAAQGWDGANRPYRRSDSVAAQAYEWVFEGVEDEVIGGSEGPLGGAAGDEIDRAAPERGTPPETVVLATARGFSDAYQVVVEDVPEMGPETGGSTNPSVRAEITMTPYPRGGACFAVGSIAWSAALASGEEAGDVARITENVLARFRSDPPK